MGKMIGIDLGTTNSLATYIDETGEIKFIKNEYGNILIPSVVGINENDEVIVGELAKERRMLNPLDTASNFKRKMGTNAKIRIKGKEFDAQMLSSLVLKHLKENAERQLGSEVDKAIISVPAYFNDKQRKDTKIAAELAGLQVERLINEPTAAALSLGSSILDRNLKFLVLDLGGGTFDVTLLETFESIMEVISISGDTMLGGEDFTTKICEIFLKKNGFSLGEFTKEERTLIYTKADRVKKLIGVKNVEMNIRLKEKEYSTMITQEDFKEAVKPLLVRMKNAIDIALKDGNTDPSEIEKIVLVGGAVKMGIIREFTEKYFEKLRSRNNSFNENYYEENDFINGEELVSIIGEPDSAVAYGAGVTVGMKERNKAFSERILTDVCPFTLGIEVIGKKFSPIIHRNTTVPASKSEYYYTVHDNQNIIRIAIYQGESLEVEENLFLGEFEIKVPKNKAGEEAVNVRFTYDINGILEVEATSVTTGEKRNKLLINGDLSEKKKAEKIKRLEEIKMEAESKNKDKLLIERANRIYSEISSSEIRNYISRYLEQYEMILKTDNKIKIRKAKKEFSEFLDKVDPELSDLDIDEILKDKEVKKEMEIEEDDDDLGFLN